MNEIYKILIYLLACAVNKITPDAEKIKNVDLEALYQLAKFHTVRSAVNIALERAGPSGLIGVMKDVVLMFLVTFLLFCLRALRGGDGKLLCALAALLGLQTAATILLYSLFLAVMIGAGKILRETKQKRKRKGPTGIHYSVPILCSVIIYGVRYWM